MSITIKLESDSLQHAFDRMTETIDEFGRKHMPEGLMEWQIKDMRRKYPNMDIVDDKTVVTRIWPTSRRNMAKPGYRRSTRPILREVLFETLCQRMSNLMENEIQWR
jgi:hypothetical protein